jgi:hypothetical protein
MDPTKPSPEIPVYTVQTWAYRRIVGGVADVFDDLVGFIPLGPALKQDKRLLAAKYGIPIIIDLFPAPPSVASLPFFGRNERQFVQGIEKFFARDFRGAADDVLASVLKGALDTGERSGVVVFVVPVWLADP